MARNVSAAFIEAVNATNTTEVFLGLVTIDHPDLDVPIRVTTDSVKTLSEGQEYLPFPFTLRLPTDEDDARGALAQIQIDAVDRRIVTAARQISGVPKVDISIVLASNPDAVEVSWPTFNLSNFRAQADTITGDLVFELLEQEPFPGDRFDPTLFPGLF